MRETRYLVLAGTKNEASKWAVRMGLPSTPGHDRGWIYASRPETLLGIVGLTVVTTGTFWERKDAKQIRAMVDAVVATGHCFERTCGNCKHWHPFPPEEQDDSGHRYGDCDLIPELSDKPSDWHRSGYEPVGDPVQPGHPAYKSNAFWWYAGPTDWYASETDETTMGRCEEQCAGWELAEGPQECWSATRASCKRVACLHIRKTPYVPEGEA